MYIIFVYIRISVYLVRVYHNPCISYCISYSRAGEERDVAGRATARGRARRAQLCPAAAAAAAAIVLGPVAHAPSRQDGAARDSAAQGPRAGRGSARRGAARAGRDRDGPCPGHDPSSLRRAGSPARSVRVGRSPPVRPATPADLCRCKSMDFTPRVTARTTPSGFR